MRKSSLAFLSMALMLAACGEPKTVKMDRMHTRSGSGEYQVAGKVVAVGGGIVKIKAGDVEYTDLRLQDETGEYTFHFLPADHARQPVTGDNVKMLCKGIMLSSTFGGSPTAQVIEKFEFQ